MQRSAANLLLRSVLRAGRQTFDILEIEFYVYSAELPDPFVHRHPLQATRDRWYLHRVGGGFRSGTFQGLDLTCGHGKTFGGILIRAIRDRAGRVVEGPSRVVERLKEALAVAHLAELDALIGCRSARDSANPLALLPALPRKAAILNCPRVGLSPRRHGTPGLAFLARPYRFLTDPRSIKKGKAQMVVALHRRGWSMPDIVATTGCRSAPRLIEAYEAARLGLVPDSWLPDAPHGIHVARLLGWAEHWRLSFSAAEEASSTNRPILPERKS